MLEVFIFNLFAVGSVFTQDRGSKLPMDDVIEIVSSTDSDLELEDSGGYDSETSTRISPHPGSTSAGNSSPL